MILGFVCLFVDRIVVDCACDVAVTVSDDKINCDYNF